jgi:hypothetical protein
VFEATLLHPRFLLAMTPRQTPVTVRGSPSVEQFVGTGAEAQGGNPRKRNRANQPKPHAQDKPKPITQALGNSAAGKGKAGKGAAGKGGPRLPAGLFGMCPRSSAATENKRLCFGFNLGSCKLVGPGQECAKGWHLCMKPAANGQACSQHHAATACTAC